MWAGLVVADAGRRRRGAAHVEHDRRRGAVEQLGDADQRAHQPLDADAPCDPIRRRSAARSGAAWALSNASHSSA